MRKTIKNVIMVVLVLMTSCQVSLKWKIGPVIAQSTMIPRATINVTGRPAAREAKRAAWVNQDAPLLFIGWTVLACRGRQDN
jgi:hypothetical protein